MGENKTTELMYTILGNVQYYFGANNAEKK